jgi:hypothetical protein
VGTSVRPAPRVGDASSDGRSAGAPTHLTFEPATGIVPEGCAASERRRGPRHRARRRWDLNPRLVAQHTISNRADSAALALLPECSLVRLAETPRPRGKGLVSVTQPLLF